jgi:hypothetical protein
MHFYWLVRALGFTQPLPEMSIKDLPGVKLRLVHKANSFTAICELSRKCESLEVSNSVDFGGLLQGFFVHILQNDLR